MPNPTNYVPPEWAAEMDAKMNKTPQHTLAEWVEIAASDPGECDVCGDDAWKYGGCGMCFTCTTGESDPSSDLELQVGAPWPKKKGGS